MRISAGMCEGSGQKKGACLCRANAHDGLETEQEIGRIRLFMAFFVKELSAVCMCQYQ